MPNGIRRFLLGLIAIAVCERAAAQDKCTAKGFMAGEAFTMTHCAAAIYDDAKSVALWFSEAPIPAEEIETFHLSSYPKNRGPDNKERTMIGLSFCPGGGKEAASPAAVKTVEIGVNHASSPMISNQWLLKLPADKDLKFEKLSGDVKPGGRLAGRITLKKTSDQQVYTWEIDFDVRLPERTAAAGTTCGD
ncbi:MAG: hypothetical protein WEB59_08535 [Thermoanaerobaculia bacterium]